MLRVTQTLHVIIVKQRWRRHALPLRPYGKVGTVLFTNAYVEPHMPSEDGCVAKLMVRGLGEPRGLISGRQLMSDTRFEFDIATPI